jgi:hypothetical protein
VRKDRYFVEPASLVEHGTLTIDGRRVEGAVFELERGVHTIAFEGTPSADLHILWLPRNGRTWVPDFGAQPRFAGFPPIGISHWGSGSGKGFRFGRSIGAPAPCAGEEDQG